MGLITNIFRLRAAGDEVDAADLIVAIAGERGVDPRPVNEGQVALAGWLLTAEIERVERFSRVSERTAMQLLSGEIEPADAVATYLATISDGAIAPEAFARAIEPAPATQAGETAPAAGAGGAADLLVPKDRLPHPNAPGVSVDVHAGRCAIAGPNWMVEMSRDEGDLLRVLLDGAYAAREPVPA